jgi:flagellar assembly factor FliW
MQIESTRFGPVDIRPDAVITFPEGIIGLPGRTYALLAPGPDAVFFWLQSVEHPELALPVTTPWLFFPEYRLELAEDAARRIGIDPEQRTGVMCVVRAAASLAEFRVNLRGPLVVDRARLVGHQVINEAGDHGVSEPLFAHVDLAAVTPAAPPAPVAATGI